MKQNYAKLFKPAIYGGLVFAILSSIPGLSYVNGLLLFWLIIGCFFSVHCYHKKHGEHITYGDSIHLGIYTGILGVLFTVIIWSLLDFIGWNWTPVMRLYGISIYSSTTIIGGMLSIGGIFAAVLGIFYSLLANFLHRISHDVDVWAAFISSLIVSAGIIIFTLIASLVFRIVGTTHTEELFRTAVIVIFFGLMIFGGYIFVSFYDRYSQAYLQNQKEGIIFSLLISFIVVFVWSLFTITGKIGWHLVGVEDIGAMLVLIIVISIIFSIPVVGGCLYGISKLKPKHQSKQRVHVMLENKVIQKKKLIKKKTIKKNAKKKVVKKKAVKKKAKKKVAKKKK